MRKWNMTIVYSTSVDFEVEAETYNEAVEKAYAEARAFPIETVELTEYQLGDWEELPDDNEFADGYYDNPDDEEEEEEFEPGRPILDQMALNP